MNSATISPSSIAGSISAPSSKSMAQRALALALFHSGRTLIRHAGNSEDVMAALGALNQFGAMISSASNDLVIVESSGMPHPEAEISCGESALLARISIAIAALSSNPVRITGRETLMKRSMLGFEDAFSRLGVSFISDSGRLPVTVQGPVIYDSIHIDGSHGSQYLTGLLIALAATSPRKIIIQVGHLSSRPYIDLTLSMLQRFGHEVRNHQYEKFEIMPVAPRKQADMDIHIEGDWSAAAFLMVAAAISGDIQITNLLPDSMQGDKQIISVLSQCGIRAGYHNNSFTVSKQENILPFEYDSTDTPDLFPVLAVLAAYARGVSRIRGIHRLRNKESDRAESIGNMLHSIGAACWMEQDDMYIRGGQVAGGFVNPAGDHRIAMAAAVAGLGSQQGVLVNDIGVIRKSYPSFFKDLMSLGASVTLSGEKEMT